MIKIVDEYGRTIRTAEVVQWERNEPKGNPVGSILLSAATGLGGYAIGKNQGYNNGYNDGYDQAKAEDDQLIAHYQTQLQKMSRDKNHLHTENNGLSQENGSLRKENEILRGLLRQQPTTPEAEAILKTLGRVELRLSQFLPPIYENGEDHQPLNN
jgi:regulator of replication initiation timing